MIIRIYKLFFCLISSVLLVVVLYCFSIRRIYSKNGFIRLLPSHKILTVDLMDIRYNSWQISSSYKCNVLLTNILSPDHILSVDTNLKVADTLRITGLEGIQLYKGLNIRTDSNSFFLMDGIKPTILQGDLSRLHPTQTIETKHFNSSMPLTNNSFVLRCNTSEGINVLAKQSKGDTTFKITHLLEKQVDGIFCTDGELVKIPGSNNIVYLYYYRNQFLCADSNLNLLYKGRTIDTTSHAKIKVAKIKSTGEMTMSAPPLYVNKRACASSKYLFVQSSLRANNETEYMIKDVSMIDVYAIADGKYQFSFYLPDFRGFKVRDFKVYGQSLYALYDHYLYKYQLNF